MSSIWTSIMFYAVHTLIFYVSPVKHEAALLLSLSDNFTLPARLVEEGCSHQSLMSRTKQIHQLPLSIHQKTVRSCQYNQMMPKALSHLVNNQHLPLYESSESSHFCFDSNACYTLLVPREVYPKQSYFLSLETTQLLCKGTLLQVPHYSAFP